MNSEPRCDCDTSHGMQCPVHGKGAREEKARRWRQGVASGVIDPDCDICKREFGTEVDPRPGAFAPAHEASSSCRSGRRNHCTCDTCF